jgi:RNA polymerase sigma-70 factor, ECF subfamily
MKPILRSRVPPAAAGRDFASRPEGMCPRAAGRDPESSARPRTSMPTLDAAILTGVARGDTDAMCALVREFSVTIRGMARRMSRTAADAEDATQDILLDIWRKGHRFDAARGTAAAFLVTLAKNRLLDRLRRAARDPLCLGSGAVVSLEYERTAEAHAEASLLMRRMEKLRPRQRHILELSIFHGFTALEIARDLRLPLGTVKSLKRRSLKRLRRPPAALATCGHTLR